MLMLCLLKCVITKKMLLGKLGVVLFLHDSSYQFLLQINNNCNLPYSLDYVHCVEVLF